MTAKTACGLARITEHLQEAAFCVTGIALLSLNLTRALRMTFKPLFVLHLFRHIAKRLISCVAKDNESKVAKLKEADRTERADN